MLIKVWKHGKKSMSINLCVHKTLSYIIHKNDAKIETSIFKDVKKSDMNAIIYVQKVCDKSLRYM